MLILMMFTIIFSIISLHCVMLILMMFTMISTIIFVFISAIDPSDPPEDDDDQWLVLIIGGTLLGVLVILAITGTACWCKRRRK